MSISPGRVAVVTGASRGIGAGVAKALGAAGIKVALLARSARLLDEISSQINGAGGTALAIPTDISDLGAVERAERTIRRELGEVELLVSNAAVGEPLGPLLDADPDEFATAVNVNLLGAWHVLRVFGPPMRNRGFGRIVAVSSSSAVVAFATLGAYCATKAGFEHLHSVAALELRDSGVVVNIVWPGGVDTELQASLRDDRFEFAEMARAVHARGALRTPDQIAPRILSLLDDTVQQHGQRIDFDQP